MTARPPYRDPMTLGEAMTVLERGLGSKFDPDALEACRKALLEDGLAELMKLNDDRLSRHECFYGIDGGSSSDVY